MEPGSRKKVESSTYTSDYYSLAPGLVYFHRDHNWPKASTIIDAYARFWMLAVATVEPGQLAIRHQGQVIDFSGRWALFFPPFSLVEWHLGAGRLQWGAFFSERELPSDLNREAFAFALSSAPLPSTYKDIFELLRVESKNEKRLLIAREEGVSAVAEKTKREIDATFAKDVSVEQIASKLKYSHAVMTRAFKKCYGLTPVAYRNKLRIFESAAKFILEEKQVQSVAKEVGFKDLSRFNRQFRRVLNTKPSQYQICSLGDKRDLGL